MYRFSFLFLFLSIFSLASSAQRKVSVKAYITATEDYCGGARPSDEMLRDMSTEKPLSDKVLYIKIGTVNKSTNKTVKKVKTDVNGRFEVMLSPGVTYYFIEEWKSKVFIAPKNTHEITWDISCLRKKYATPDFILKVKPVNNQEVHINYHQNCSYRPYCGQYSGPLPP
jgi:hypothetical protein